jgi:hypothetical protein
MGVGGLIEPWWLDRQPSWFPAEFGWVVGCSYTGLPTERAQVRNVIAANMAIRRDVFEAIGGFRNDFGKQGSRSEPEETDLCIRAGQAWPDRAWIYMTRRSACGTACGRPGAASRTSCDGASTRASARPHWRAWSDGGTRSERRPRMPAPLFREGSPTVSRRFSRVEMPED